MVIMRTALKEWDILGLTPAEAKVLLALGKHNTLSVSEIARHARVPRTTVTSALRRLKKRRLVRHLASGHKSFWKASRSEKIKRELEEALVPFEKETQRLQKNEIIGGIDSREIGISVFRGEKQMRRAYEQMLRLSKAERVLFIQGNVSAEKALKTIDSGYISEFHKKFKKSGIIMEGVSGKSVLELFKNIDIPFLQSHLGRLVVGTLVPDDYMSFDLDLMVMRDMVVSVDVSAKLVVMIRYPKLVNVLSGMAQFLKDRGSRIDFNAHIKQLIEQKEKTAQ